MPIFTSDVSVDNTVLIEGGNTTAVKTDGSGVTQPVSGSVSVSGAVTTNQGNAAALAGAWPVEITDGTNVLGTSANPVNIITAVSSTATITQVVLTNNTNGTLLSANANRKSAIIFVPSQTLQIKYGATASTTSFTYKVTSANTTITVTGYTGRIDAFGSGQTVTITELT